MTDFTEQAEIEKGFAPVFRERIAPELDRLESFRLELLGKARRNALIAFAIGAVLAVVVFLTVDGNAGTVFGVILLIVGGIAAAVARSMQAGRWTGSVADVVMPPVCEFLGDTSYDRQAGDGFPTGRMRDIGVLASHDKARLTDRLAGTYRDVPYELVEAHLTRRSQDSDNKTTNQTVFNGMLFRIGLPAPAPTTILIARDYGSLGNRMAGMVKGGTGRGMPRVDTGHPPFEDKFELHAAEPTAVQGYLPPPFLDSLVAIALEEGGDAGAKSMTAGFEGDSFYLALWRKKPFLQMARLSEPVHGIEKELHVVFEDISVVRRIIDRLVAG